MSLNKIFTAVVVVLAAVIVVATATSVSTEDTNPINYGSYVVLCNSWNANVTFVNYPQRDCEGEPSLYVMPLNQCHTESYMNKNFSWNGFCNSTNMWYNNFEGLGCKEGSVLSRWYVTYQCKNCPNKECKNQ